MLVDTCSGLEDSVIVGNNRNYLRNLTNWLSPVAHLNSVWKCCWRASVDGWAGTTFHSRCDGKGPTVTIIRVGKCIFGGYASMSWGKFTNAKRYSFTTNGYQLCFETKNLIPIVTIILPAFETTSPDIINV